LLCKLLLWWLERCGFIYELRLCWLLRCGLLGCGLHRDSSWPRAIHEHHHVCPGVQKEVSAIEGMMWHEIAATQWHCRLGLGWCGSYLRRDLHHGLRC